MYQISKTVNMQSHLLGMINRYENAYKDTIRLIRSREQLSLTGPLIESARFYKERILDLRLKLIQMEINERMQ
jgi:hypothetical protein